MRLDEVEVKARLVGRVVVLIGVPFAVVYATASGTAGLFTFLILRTVMRAARDDD